MPAIYLLLTLTVFWRLWTPISDARGSWKYDPPHEYWGDLIFQEDTLGSGQLALWNPYDRGGFPVYGDPQPGMFYPPNWPLLIWGALGDALPFAIASFKILMHWVFGAIGMHLLLRRMGGKEPACYSAGILFSFTSPKFRYMGSALNWSIAWIPWVLLAVHYFAEKPDKRRAIIMGSALAMVLLSGAPAVVLYALVLALPYGLYLMWGRIVDNWRTIAMSAGITLLWILPLIASNLQQLPESVRETRNYEFITFSSFSPGHLVTYLVPRLGNGENPYIGGMAFIGIGLALASRKERNLGWLFLGVAGFSIAIAFGSHAGFLPALASAVTPFSLFRRAHRYLYITSVALTIVSSLGFAYLLNLDDKERRTELARSLSWIGGAVSFALGVAYLVSIAMADPIGVPRNEGFGLAFLSAAGFTIVFRQLLLAGPRFRNALAWVIPLLVFFDLWTANFQVADVGMEKPPITANDGKLAELEGLDREWRIYDDDFLKYRPGTRLGIRDFSGYEGDPLSLSRYNMLLEASKKTPTMLGHANVRYLLGGQGKIKGQPSMGTLIKPGIWELKKRAPAVYYTPTPSLATTSKEALQALRRIQPGEGAVVEAQLTPGDATLPMSTGTLTLLEPNHLRAEIETPGPGLIVIAEAYYPEWRATLDGKSAAILPANVMFRGIAVSSAGKHVIDMTLAPRRFYALLPAFLAAFVLLLVALLRPKRMWPKRMWPKRMC